MLKNLIDFVSGKSGSNEITLDCYTDRPDVFYNSKIEPTSRKIPSWFKSIPVDFGLNEDLTTTSSIRRCSGVNSLFTSGYVISMWSDLRVELGEIGSKDYRWQYADKKSDAGEHPVIQRGNYAPPEQYQHLKLESPWHFHCSHDIPWVWLQNNWLSDIPDEYLIPPSIVEYHYQSTTNVNILFARSNDKKLIDIKLGAPLVQIVPMTDKKVTVNHHLVSTEELNALNAKNGSSMLSFVNSYQKTKKIKKCPFSGN
jgi:hypothetical protein